MKTGATAWITKSQERAPAEVHMAWPTLTSNERSGHQLFRESLTLLMFRDILVALILDRTTSKHFYTQSKSYSPPASMSRGEMPELLDSVVLAGFTIYYRCNGSNPLANQGLPMISVPSSSIIP